MFGLAALQQAGSWRALASRSRAAATSVALGGIVAVAVAARMTSALLQGNAVEALPGVFDQISYDMLARQVLAGYGFTVPVDWWPATHAGEPTAHWSYLYTLYLAAIYAVFGPYPVVARLIQAVAAGILQPWLTWRIGARVFGGRAGLIAAALSAGYAYFVYYAGALMTETFCILAILWAIDVATSLAGQRGRGAARIWVLPARPALGASALRPWLLLGLAFGLAGLLRQVALVLLPVTLLWLVWTRWRRGSLVAPGARRTLVAGACVSVAVVGLAIAPWTARNYLAFGRFVPLNTNSGYALFWANHPVHGTDFVPLLPYETYLGLIPSELRGLDEAALDGALLQRGLRFVAEDPGRYLRLSASRIESFFQFWPTPESGSLSNVSRVLSFGILLPFMLVGLLLSAASVWRRGPATGDSLVLLYSLVVAHSLVHLLSWALIRYRLPVDAILLLFAGLAVAELGDRPVGKLVRRFAGRGT